MARARLVSLRTEADGLSGLQTMRDVGQRPVELPQQTHDAAESLGHGRPLAAKGVELALERAVAPAKLAQAPPPAPPKSASRTIIRMTGAEGGSHPDPRYPQAALEQRQQGTVTVIMTVSPDGLVESVEIKKSSGYGILDRHVTQWVKTRFKFLPIESGEKRYFEKDFVFQLQ